MTKLFGTDGIRGIANVVPMTVETALAIGRATAHICRRHDKRHRIVIGKDTRLSGYMLENALTAGICSMGVDVLLLGPLPTPGIAFTTRNMRADAGIVISASHNPYQDNGIFQELGADVIPIHNKPDGRNINANCGSQHTADMIKAVREHKADLGLAFDGDGDRLIAVDETGTELSGDFLMAICAIGMQKAGTLKNNKVIITCMTNISLRRTFDRMGITYPEADVGDRK